MERSKSLNEASCYGWVLVPPRQYVECRGQWCNVTWRDLFLASRSSILNNILRIQQCNACELGSQSRFDVFHCIKQLDPVVFGLRPNHSDEVEDAPVIMYVGEITGGVLTIGALSLCDRSL